MEKRMPAPRSDKRIIVQRGTRFIGDWIGRTFFYSFDSQESCNIFTSSISMLTIEQAEEMDARGTVKVNFSK